MPQEKFKDRQYVVVISSKEERNKLFEFCIAKNVPILYPELFQGEKINHLWGISKEGVGLVSTQVARATKEDHIIRADELSKLKDKIKD